jgi:hypothetical protein
MSPILSRARACLSAVVCLAVCSVAVAGQVRLDLIPGNGTVGGPFKATVISGFVGNPAGTTFKTFCLERGETFSPGHTYDVVVSDREVSGANGGNPSGFDLLDSATAYLYSNFRHGTLGAALNSFAGVSFNDADMSHLTALQNVIWKLEGETFSFAEGSLSDELFDMAVANKNGSLYDVRVMQLWEGTQRRQDQLMLVPLPAAAVAGLALFPVTLAAGHLRRRRGLA